MRLIAALAKASMFVAQTTMPRVASTRVAAPAASTFARVSFIASNARLTFPAAVDQVVFKDGVKCVLTLSKSPQARSLADAEGSYVTIVIESRSKLLDEGDSTETQPDQKLLLGEDADGVAA
jgi:hypothetical protein